MATTADRIIEQLRIGTPLADDVLARRLGLIRQAINQTARGLEAGGILKRYVGPEGKIVNELIVGATPRAADGPLAAREPSSTVEPRITEDEVKGAVKHLLEADGYLVKVAWGHARGVDIEATKAGSRLVIEAKGEAPAGAQQNNHFLNALGELVKGIDDPDAEYGLAFPEHRQYAGRVERLPTLAWERLKLRVWFVSRDGSGLHAREVN